MLGLPCPADLPTGIRYHIDGPPADWEGLDDVLTDHKMTRLQEFHLIFTMNTRYLNKFDEIVEVTYSALPKLRARNLLQLEVIERGIGV